MDLLKYNGFDDAIVGISLAQPNREPCLIYDYDLCVEIVLNQGEMSVEDAEEFVTFNLVDVHIGESNPIFMIKNFEQDIDTDEKPKLRLVK